MYQVRNGTFKDVQDLDKRSIEPGPFVWTEDDFIGCTIRVIEFSGQPIAIFFFQEHGDGIISLGCEFDKDLIKHLRAVLYIGREMLREYGYNVINTQVQEEWPKGKKFLERLGFEPQKTVEKNPRNGVLYRVYRRIMQWQ